MLASVVSAIVSICALVFTVGSFWWLFARQGDLVAYEPYSFAAQVIDTSVLHLRFPLVLENTGPKALIIHDLRLCFPDVPNSTLPIPWKTSRSELKPSSLDGHKFPAVFALPGRSAAQYFIEFGAPFPGFELERLNYNVRIEAKVAHKEGWQTLLGFTLRAGNIISPTSYITYSNAPFTPTAEDTEKADATLHRLLEDLSQSPEEDVV